MQKNDENRSFSSAEHAWSAAETCKQPKHVNRMGSQYFIVLAEVPLNQVLDPQMLTSIFSRDRLHPERDKTVKKRQNRII